MKARLKQNSYMQSYISYLMKNGFSVGYDDYHLFSTKDFPRGDEYFRYDTILDRSKFNSIEYLHKGQRKSSPFTQFMTHTGTTALILIKDDQIYYEDYFNGHERGTPHKLFSITKSYVSALVGIAINQGLFHLDDQITTYIPELKLKSMTIKQLLQMDSGIKFKEGLLPWNDEAKVYLHPNARELALSVVEDSSGSFFHYNDYHSLLLGLILERVTGQSVSEYMYQAILSKLGLEFQSHWILDSEKHAFEKTESGLVMTAIDLAKFGSLYLKQGKWQGEQLISPEWIQESTSREHVICDKQHFQYYENHPWGKMWFRQNKAYYKYLWWGNKNREENNDYFALGNLGQVLYISPENNAIAIRLGKKWGVMDWWPSILHKLINTCCADK
ncbi:serine hydrolase [Bacillus sp. S/N-304-OC-R1]|uniref:serine hydrolase domain-containing protein n=1 Tax=Bacillus sp. S/N-304-OC-R1 TaxID=2758034 RepID=UPI001C8DC393|nr:serine hydrolase [Bacillus sp. S/N-304-OC-R1]MBY0122072.1 serine hydrolase [Bacillus sp. S/N-304-OC-R1]